MEQHEPIQYLVSKQAGLEVLQSIWDMIKEGDIIQVNNDAPIRNFTVIQGGNNGSNS